MSYEKETTTTLFLFPLWGNAVKLGTGVIASDWKERSNLLHYREIASSLSLLAMTSYSLMHNYFLKMA